VTDWCDEVALWRAAVATTSASNPHPRSELADALRRSGRTDLAFVEYDRLAADTGDPKFVANAATALVDLGRYDDAVERMRALRRIVRPGPLEHFNLGLAEARRLRFAAAEAELQQALRLYPTYGEARTLLADVRVIEPEWRGLPAEHPDEPGAIRARRALLLERLGARPRATALWSSVAVRTDASGEDLLRAALGLARGGAQDGARRALARARAAGAARDAAERVEALLTSGGSP
jgi:tetratricopeptide (TPR) repeat protein